MHGGRCASDGGEARQMKIHPIISRPHRDVVHMRFFTQDALCRAFIRLQEFYESPYPKIRGNFFTLDEFKRRYVQDHGKPFSYYKDWHGFNVPGRTVRAFAKMFAHDLTFEERRIVDLKPMGYLIATWKDADFDHEFAHALYHLKRPYQNGIRRLVKRFETNRWSLSVAFKAWLKKYGYTEKVFIDEIGAYFATNDLSDFENDFSKRRAYALWEAAWPFRDLYHNYGRPK
jgi:hypothetical protein